jgi:hypothetical protein
MQHRVTLARHNRARAVFGSTRAGRVWRLRAT